MNAPGTPPLPDEAFDVLTFWFIELKPSDWFNSSDALDRAIKHRFGETLERASNGALDHWTTTPQGTLALVIVLDQFSRNVHRGAASAYAQDQAAQELVMRMIETGRDDELGHDQRQFLYMPLIHAEDRDMQRLSVEKFKALAESAANVIGFAEKHRDIVEKYGRFPYRNPTLGRDSTPLEAEFIAENGNPFS